MEITEYSLVEEKHVCEGRDEPRVTTQKLRRRAYFFYKRKRNVFNKFPSVILLLLLDLRMKSHAINVS